MVVVVVDVVEVVVDVVEEVVVEAELELVSTVEGKVRLAEVFVEIIAGGRVEAEEVCWLLVTVSKFKIDVVVSSTTF